MQKSSPSDRNYATCSACNTLKRQDTIASRDPVICKPCINQKEGKGRGKKRARTETVSEFDDGTTKQQGLML
jgi:hypothetical protein